MRKWERAAQARRALDRRFASQRTADLLDPPRGGWVKAIRTALGMSQADLAARLGVSPPAVADLEQADRAGAITVRRLQRVADELDCTLIVALVPNTSLESTVRDQARRQAAASLGYIGRTMDLEDQGLDDQAAADVLDREARRVVEQHRVWSTG